MVRISKQGKRRKVSPRRPRLPGIKTGPVADKLANGFKEHANAVQGNLSQNMYIAKVR